MIKLKPVPGRIVPDPERGDMLPPEGRSVRPSVFWQRRVIDGDVEPVTEPPETANKRSKAP